MNKERVIQFASNVFGNLVSVSEDLYKAELVVGDKKAGIYYLDLNEHIPIDNFNEYQDKILAKEYYNHPGNLQWNYYLFLLQDQIDPAKKSTIELNDKYARKYIFNEDEFKDFFLLESSTPDINSNIITEWKEALDKADLQEVYSKEAYTDLVYRFETNTTKKHKIEVSTSTVQPATVNNIKHLWLKPNYRKYPLEPRDFEFSRVNLITGINGVGKTCLFEAIETIVCGRTFRNPDDKAEDGCIEAIFNSSKTIEKCIPSNNEKYRKLDSFWYSNNYTRDNFLHNSFNKFNLFNADAAHRFATSNSEQEVKSALLNIVLGPEYDYISDRIIKVYERVRPAYNRIDAAINEANKKLKEAEIKIERLSESQTIDDITKIIIKNVSDLKFRNKTLLTDNNFFGIENINNTLSSIISLFLTNGQIIDISQLDKEKTTNDSKKEKLDLFEKEYKKIIDEKQKHGDSLKSLKTKQEFISDLLKYYSHESLFLIDGLSVKIKENENALMKLRFIERSLQNIDLNQFVSDETIQSINSKLTSDLVEAKMEIAKAEESISTYLNRFSQLEKIIKQIKELGRKFLEVNPEEKNCPLCHTTFSPTELMTRIQQLSKVDNHEDLSLLSLNRDLDTLNIKFKELTEYETWLNTINSAYIFLGEDFKLNYSLNYITDLLKEFIRSIPKHLKIDTELKSLQELANSFNVTEEEFASIKIKLPVLFDDTVSFSPDNKDVFMRLMSSITEEIKVHQSFLSSLEEQLAASATNIKSQLGLSSDGTYTLAELKSQVLREETLINSALENFNKLKELIEVQDDTNLNELALLSSILEKNLGTLKREQQNQYELNTAKQQKSESELYVSKNGKLHARYKVAYDTLSRLTSNKGNEQLEVFFNQNLKEIVDIFKTIHAPREFDNIILQNGNLLLINQKKERRKITQISTGQRSALALSIFITLNRKLKNGPNIIMFDDPVSFIDDLNALSFLDFLRFFLLKENKQIFFATANSRLASLFEKKFEFLSEDFKKWELKRP